MQQILGGLQRSPKLLSSKDYRYITGQKMSRSERFFRADLAIAFT